jgi:hypothetical protein
MDPLTLAAGDAVVKAVATDNWQQARTALVRLWRRKDPGETTAISHEIDATRISVLAARDSDDDAAEERLAAQWHRRFSALVGKSPETSAELQDVLDEDLSPLLSSPEQDHIFTVGQHIQAGRDTYVAGRDMTVRRDQTINE